MNCIDMKNRKDQAHHMGHVGETGLMMKMRVRGSRNVGAVEIIDVNHHANSSFPDINR